MSQQRKTSSVQADLYLVRIFDHLRLSWAGICLWKSSSEHISGVNMSMKLGGQQPALNLRGSGWWKKWSSLRFIESLYMCALFPLLTKTSLWAETIGIPFYLCGNRHSKAAQLPHGKQRAAQPTAWPQALRRPQCPNFLGNWTQTSDRRHCPGKLGASLWPWSRSLPLQVSVSFSVKQGVSHPRLPWSPRVPGADPGIFNSLRRTLYIYPRHKHYQN